MSTPFLPALYALLPPTSHKALTSQLSLRSLHSSSYTITESIYTSTTAVVPGQMRNVRLRSRPRSASSSSGSFPRKGRGGAAPPGKGQRQMLENEALGQEGGEEEHEVLYLSNPMVGGEYRDMDVRGCLGVDVVGLSDKAEVEGLVRGLGFHQYQLDERDLEQHTQQADWLALMVAAYRLSHSFSKKGAIFYLPLPLPSISPITLLLTISRIPSGLSEPADESEPYLVQLEPSRPVLTVPPRGEIGLQDMMRVMRTVSGRIDMLEWGSGRPR